MLLETTQTSETFGRGFVNLCMALHPICFSARLFADISIHLEGAWGIHALCFCFFVSIGFFDSF